MTRPWGTTVWVVLALCGSVAGELAAQSPAHPERGDYRERVHGVLGHGADERAPLGLLALQPLVFEPASAGEIRIVDPLVDQGGRGEFEITGDGWVEVTVSVRMEESDWDGPLTLELRPADIVAVDPSGRHVASRAVEHLRDSDGTTVRKEILVQGSVLLFVGGAVAPGLDQQPGKYRSRVAVGGRYLDR